MNDDGLISINCFRSRKMRVRFPRLSARLEQSTEDEGGTHQLSTACVADFLLKGGYF